MLFLGKLTDNRAAAKALLTFRIILMKCVLSFLTTLLYFFESVRFVAMTCKKS